MSTSLQGKESLVNYKCYVWDSNGAVLWINTFAFFTIDFQLWVCVCVLSEYGVRTQIPYQALCFVSHHQSLFSYLYTHLSDVLFIYKCFMFHFLFALPTSQCFRLWIDRDFHAFGFCAFVWMRYSDM